MKTTNVIHDNIGRSLNRFLSIDSIAVNVDKRTISLAFSSETPVERYFGFEILDHSPGACDLSRLNDGAPLMDNHCELIGVVEAATIDADRIGRCVARFSKSGEAEEIFQDVVDKIRSKASVGYRVLAMVLEDTANGIDTYRITKWQPFEVSVVDIPADNSVGVGRSLDTSINHTLQIGVKKMTLEENATQESAEKSARQMQVDATLRAERSRVAEISATAMRFMDRVPEMGSIKEKAINEGWDESKFRSAVLESIPGMKHVENPNPNLGMGEADLRAYSLTKAIRTLGSGKQLDGIEAEASRAYAKLTGRNIGGNGFIIPNDVMVAKRALTTQTAGAGGYTVGSQMLGGEMIEMLQNKQLVVALGARSLTGLVGNVAIPKVGGGATAYWLSSNGTVSRTDQSFGQLALSPHRLVASTAYDKELLNQSSIDVEGFVREDLMRVIAIEKDRAAINGSGANGEPLGILGVPTGLGSVSFGATATWAKVVSFETKVATANADVESMAYLTTAATRGAWKGIQKAANLSFIWETGVNGSGLVNGYRAEATKQVPSDKVIFGNWQDIIIADWAGIDVVVDPYTLSLNGQISLVVTQWSDVGVRHAGSFAVSSDSGAQ